MRLRGDFFGRDVLVVAPEIIGKKLFRNIDGKTTGYSIVEVEAYRGEEDEASHARFGKTSRNGIMYGAGGLVYVYMIYGIHWMLNIVTGPPEQPQALLIRGIKGFEGPGRLTRVLEIDRSFYGEDLALSSRIWIETGEESPSFTRTPRIGIDYAGEPWKSMAWRYRLGD
jgi:DNA-3-methyladenine glycosylase